MQRHITQEKQMAAEAGEVLHTAQEWRNEVLQRLHQVQGQDHIE